MNIQLFQFRYAGPTGSILFQKRQAGKDGETKKGKSQAFLPFSPFAFSPFHPDYLYRSPSFSLMISSL